MGSIAFVGMDSHKATIAVAVAEGVRDGEVRQLAISEPGEIIAKLAGERAELLLRGRPLWLRRHKAMHDLVRASHGRAGPG